MNRISCFRSYVIADTGQTDDDNIVIDRIFHKRFLRIAECENTHRFGSQFVDLFVQSRLIELFLHAVCIQICYGLRKQLLRSAFIKRPADRIDSRLTKFIRRIKALTCRHYIVFIRVYRMKGFFSHKLHQRLIGCVPTDDFMRSVEQRLRIFPDRQIHHTFDFGMSAKFRNRNGTAVCRKEIHHFKHAFCNRTRLIAEQNI